MIQQYSYMLHLILEKGIELDVLKRILVEHFTELAPQLETDKGAFHNFHLITNDKLKISFSKFPFRSKISALDIFFLETHAKPVLAKAFDFLALDYFHPCQLVDANWKEELLDQELDQGLMDTVRVSRKLNIECVIEADFTAFVKNVEGVSSRTRLLSDQDEEE